MYPMPTQTRHRALIDEAIVLLRKYSIWGIQATVWQAPQRQSADGQSASLAWSGKSDSERQTDGVHPIMCTPFFDGKHIYSVCSYGELRCLDAVSGRRLWSTLEATGRGRWWNAFLIRHEDRFFIHNEQGELIIASLTPQGVGRRSVPATPWKVLPAQSRSPGTPPITI